MKPKHCQRCGKEFECKSGSISVCQCQAVALSEEQRGYIDSRYSDCLCTACLIALRDDFNQLRHEEKNTAI